MSSVIINSTLILNGNLTCNGDITITSSGLVIPVPDSDLKKSFYSYQADSYIFSNGCGRTITSTTGNIVVQGLIDGVGQGFGSDKGPGTNSIKFDSSGNKLNGYGASHAGLGYISLPGAPEPAKTYGNHETPVSLGSGSGPYHPPSEFFTQETCGGGAIKLLARSGNISVNGSINMNGQDGTHVGGASGGSIWLFGWNIDGIGSLSAEGGSTFLPTNSGGGGGGYISLWYDHTNSFSGSMSVLGKMGGGSGKIFIKQTEPILEERFTGKIFNTKWWDYTGNITLNNYVTLISPAGDFFTSTLTSLFNISGRNITATVDYIPTGPEISQYSLKFLMYADKDNWFGVARQPTGLFGISSANGIISSSGIPFDNTNVTFRILKTDGTFYFQYYDATSVPQTIYEDVREELANRVFRVFMNLEKPDSTNRIGQYRLTPLDITNQYVQMDGTFTDMTSVALNVIGGPSQRYGIDFTTAGNKVIWDSTLGSILSSGDIVRIVYTSDPDPNAMAGSFDSLKIYEGVISNAETTESVLYVDSDVGSDSSDGRQLNPLKNLFVATAWSKKGGTVVLYDGTYNPTYVARKDITIRGAEGAKPLITTKYSQDTTGSGWEANALSFYGCQGRVENVQIADSAVGIRIENTEQFEVSRNLIHDVNTGISFINCDPIICRNRVYDASTALNLSYCRNTLVVSNVIHDSSIGVSVNTVKDFIVTGNTIDACEIAVEAKDSSGVVSSNNLTYSSIGLKISSDSTIKSYYNNYGGDAIAYSGTPASSAGDISSNPCYINRFGIPETKDYHLTNISPDINAGQSTFDSYLIDYDGANRTDGTDNVDIGAYEFIDGTHAGGDYYVASNGNDYWNFGNLHDPFRTLDKAMQVADSTIHIEGGYYDSYYLKLKSEKVIIDSPFAIYAQPLKSFLIYHTLDSTNVMNKFIKLPGIITPEDFTNVTLNVIGGPTQHYGIDFIIESNDWFGKTKLSWDGLGLDGLVGVGDVFRIQFTGGLQHKFLNLVIRSHYSNIEKERAIFVSPNGSDSSVLGGDGTNTGGTGSFELPYRTIDRALMDASSGDYIIAIAGEYPLFTGREDRIVVPAIDRTAIPEKVPRRYYEDLFMPLDFRAYGTTEYDNTNWILSYAGNSYANIGGGFLSLTYDGSNVASAVGDFQIVNDYEVSAVLRNAVDPIKFSISNSDSTIYFIYDGSAFIGGVYTGGVNYWCDGTISFNETIQDRYVTEYIPIDANDIRNKFASLSYLPEPDISNTCLNVVGGVAQNYGEDYYIEDSKIKWDGMNLDGELEPGDILRVIYLDKRLSIPLRVSLSLKNSVFVVKYFESGWHTIIMKNINEPYTGPWTVMFSMDKANPINHDSIFGKGFVSEFLAIGASFENSSVDIDYKFRTERRNLVLYQEKVEI